MSESFTAVAGRQVVSQHNAEPLGDVTHVLLDARRHEVSSLIVGKGRKALVLDWANVAALGPDAVMVTDAGALRAPGDDRESAAADGRLELIGKRALDEGGNDLGEVTDVRFDPHSGAIESFLVGESEQQAVSLLGAGAYAAVFHASTQ
jgi:sporulation protein YlmC with PRC-barrel domain